MLFKVKSKKPVPGKISNFEICKVVQERLLVCCVYIDGAERWIEPHCHGHSQAGHEILSAYQLADESGEHEGWKMFDVEKLVVFTVSGKKFVVRDDFNPVNPGITQIHCLVERGRI